MDPKATTDSDTMRPILVTGATGYVGGRLVPLLLAAGYRVRASARNPQRLKQRPWSGHPNVEIVAMDALDLASVDAAVTGCGVVYYLIHSMIAGKSGFAEADRTAALNMAAVAAVRKVKRIIYLGNVLAVNFNLSGCCGKRVIGWILDLFLKRNIWLLEFDSLHQVLRRYGLCGS